MYVRTCIIILYQFFKNNIFHKFYSYIDHEGLLTLSANTRFSGTYVINVHQYFIKKAN